MPNRRITATVVSTAVASSLVVIAPATAAEDAGSRFTLGVIPDTQFYSRYSTPETGNLASERYGSEPYQAQMEWLADNQDALNMEFATHLGDVVDQADVAGEWDVADKAMRVLDDSDLNYSILPGNHDMADDDPFGTHFPASRAAGNDTFGERHEVPNQESEYHIFEAEGQQYLVLALAWRANDATLDWAQGVIDAHPDLPVILTTHEALNIDGQGQVFYSDDYGQGLWDKFIRKNDQIFLTMGGHHHGAGYRVDTNDAGHEVVSILQDYQMAYQGGNGLLGVLEFDLSGNELEMAALSPWVAKKPHAELTQFDKLILDGEGDSYRIPLNFQERFAGFAPEWEAGDGEEGDLAGKAKEIVAEGYQPYEITDDELPIDDQDYVQAEDTVFHWRPGQTTLDGKQLAEGEAAGRGSVIPDINGDGALTRESGLDDRVTYSTEHHPLSADAGSLYWSDPAGKPAVAWFKSAPDAAINNVDTSRGYTFESFVKLPADFDGEKHGWGNAIARDSSIADLVDGSTDTDPTVMMGVSNLRELRWWAEPEEGSGSTVWSHEVPTDEWMHVAVVNNPDRDTVEMFINGAPILRNAAGAQGLLPRELRWVMGAGMDDKRPQDPWYGWIGETRLVNSVIDEDEWLTARAHNAGDATDAGSSNGSSSDSSSSNGSSSDNSSSSSSSSKAGPIVAIIAALAAGIGLAFNWRSIAAQLDKFGIHLPR